jgi:hypothetical protein
MILAYFIEYVNGGKRLSTNKNPILPPLFSEKMKMGEGKVAV